MNQAYFTFCCSGEGKSLSGLGGDRVRAAVTGTSENGLNLYKQYCNYPQYSQTSKNEQEPETELNSPQFAKLVFGITETGTGVQRFLAHSVYALPDNETLREGNYFSHLLYSLPESWTVRTALEMWGSQFWVTQDSDDITPELPPIDENDIPFGIINENAFIEFLNSSPERQNKFSFLLNSLLTIKSNEKIVLTGLPEDAAFCLWGATRCLPMPMWNNITFSTHEKLTLSFSFAVVNFPLPATWNNQEEYIFHELTQRPNFRFYCNSQQSPSSESAELPVVKDILDICLNGEFYLLDDFYQTIPQTWNHSGAAVQLFWKFLNRPEQISTGDIREALKIQELKIQALSAIMDAARFSLDQQLEFYDILDAQKQDVLLNRLISENTIEQIRSNEKYSNLLISTLKTPEAPIIPEKKLTFFQKLIRKIIAVFKE